MIEVFWVCGFIQRCQLLGSLLWKGFNVVSPRGYLEDSLCWTYTWTKQQGLGTSHPQLVPMDTHRIMEWLEWLEKYCVRSRGLVHICLASWINPWGLMKSCWRGAMWAAGCAEFCSVCTANIGSTTTPVFVDILFLNKRHCLIHASCERVFAGVVEFVPFGFVLVFRFFFLLTFQSTPSKLRTIEAFCMLETSIKICNSKWREWQPLELKTSSMLATQKLRRRQQLSAFLGGSAASTLVIWCLHSKTEKYCISLKKIKDLGKQYIILSFRGKPESLSSYCYCGKKCPENLRSWKCGSSQYYFIVQIKVSPDITSRMRFTSQFICFLRQRIHVSHCLCGLNISPH